MNLNETHLHPNTDPGFAIPSTVKYLTSLKLIITNEKLLIYIFLQIYK